jgi:hypothetical protein
VNDAVTVRMWEARAQPGRLDELIAWLRESALPAIEAQPRHIASEVFSSAADERLVVISRWRGESESLDEPPSDLVARAPHAWDFTPVDR